MYRDTPTLAARGKNKLSARFLRYWCLFCFRIFFHANIPIEVYFHSSKYNYICIYVLVQGFGFIELSDRASGHAHGEGPSLQPTCHELRNGALRHPACVVWFCLSSHVSTHSVCGRCMSVCPSQPVLVRLAYVLLHLYEHELSATWISLGW